MVTRRWQCGSRGGDGGSTAVAASLAVEAAAWQKWDFSASRAAFGNAAAVWWWQQQQQCVGGGSMACADNNFNCHDDNDD